MPLLADEVTRETFRAFYSGLPLRAKIEMCKNLKVNEKLSATGIVVFNDVRADDVARDLAEVLDAEDVDAFHDYNFWSWSQRMLERFLSMMGVFFLVAVAFMCVTLRGRNDKMKELDKFATFAIESNAFVVPITIIGSFVILRIWGGVRYAKFDVHMASKYPNGEYIRVIPTHKIN